MKEAYANQLKACGAAASGSDVAAMKSVDEKFRNLPFIGVVELEALKHE